MSLDDFVGQIKRAFPVGAIIDNPGGGTSTIAGYSDSKISYNRRNSSISVAFSDLYEAYSHFKGQRVSSTELREFMPSVFDSAARPAGHSCNCTFLFRILENLHLSGPITGSGVRGNPYSVKVSIDGAV